MTKPIYFMKKSKNSSCGLGSIGGTTVLGERGQLVIPKEMRDHLKLKAGDSFLVIEHFGKVVLVPEVLAGEFIHHITKEWDKFSNKKSK